MNCLLCLEITTNLANSVRVTSSTWDNQNIESIIEKHLWPVTVFKTESHWLCMTCWQELSDFHKFYKRIEDLHLSHKSLLTTNPDDLSVPDEKLLEPEIELNVAVAAIKQENYDSDLDNGDSIEDIIPIIQMRKCIDSNLIEDPLNKTQRIRKTRTERISHRKNAVNSNKSIEKRVKTEVEEVKGESDTADSLHKTGISMASSDNKNTTDRRSYYQPKTNRREGDKFVAKHFKLNCNVCQESFETFSILLKHFEKVHRERGYAICCEIKFYDRIRLVDHINYHLDPEYFKCKHCSEVLTQRRSLINHMKIHEEKQFSCGVCSKKFVDKFKLDQHKLTHMSKADRKFPCAECGKLYSSEARLTLHQNVVHLNKYAKLCTICGQSMINSSTFRLHMEKHEGIQPTKYSCDICGLIVAGKSPLKVHMDYQHPEGGKKEYTCHICSKVSPTLRALKKHIHCTHEMGYNYKCTICEKAFKRPENLKAHIATHTGNDLYNCPWCPKTFKSNGNMHQHRKNVHPKEWEEDRRKRYSGKLPPSCKPTSTTPNANKNVLTDTDMS